MAFSPLTVEPGYARRWPRAAVGLFLNHAMLLTGAIAGLVGLTHWVPGLLYVAPLVGIFFANLTYEGIAVGGSSLGLAAVKRSFTQTACLVRFIVPWVAAGVLVSAVLLVVIYKVPTQIVLTDPLASIRWPFGNVRPEWSPQLLYPAALAAAGTVIIPSGASFFGAILSYPAMSFLRGTAAEADLLALAATRKNVLAVGWLNGVFAVLALLAVFCSTWLAIVFFMAYPTMLYVAAQEMFGGTQERHPELGPVARTTLA